ncbi:ABC transporter permease [Rugosimonospora acidiphila]|uniref:ABC transporter permease n=1 Tax=Rugosimonospora acidiphila TaxID=556531 RepID=A0ABP9RIU3_9ACTN
MTTIEPSPVVPATAPPATGGARGRGRGRGARGYLRRPAVVASLVILLLLVLVAFVGPALTGQDPLNQDSPRLLGPSAAHWLGTDELGRDLFTRAAYGIRVDLLVLVIAVPVALVLGSLLGLVSASSRLLDAPVQRVFDVVLAFPSLILGLALAALLHPGVPAVIVTVIVVDTPIFARVLRTAVRAQRERDYVLAERLLGVGPARLYLRHILPNCLGVLIVQTGLSASMAVFLEGALSFIGLGVRPPQPSLGVLLNASLTYLQTRPLYALGPIAIISALVLCFTALSDALQAHRWGKR